MNVARFALTTRPSVRFPMGTHETTSAMNRSGPVILIEDDHDDQHMVLAAFKSLKYANEIICFTDGRQALDFLNTTNVIPFLILSDINMPKLDGFELREKIRLDAGLQAKCIPYLFFSTAAQQDAVIKAYSLSVQGFFIKPIEQEEIEKTISVIMEYWHRCASPNNFGRGLLR